MASPVKAFIDPTAGPFRMLDQHPGYPSPILWSSDGGRYSSALPTPPDYRMILLGTTVDSDVLANRVFSEIPPPPMGRMMLATFPPIYKERKADLIGQVFPLGVN